MPPRSSPHTGDWDRRETSPRAPTNPTQPGRANEAAHHREGGRLSDPSGPIPPRSPPAPGLTRRERGEPLGRPRNRDRLRGGSPPQLADVPSGGRYTWGETEQRRNGPWSEAGTAPEVGGIWCGRKLHHQATPVDLAACHLVSRQVMVGTQDDRRLSNRGRQAPSLRVPTRPANLRG